MLHLYKLIVMVDMFKIGFLSQVSIAMLLSWLICYTDFLCYAVVMIDMLHWFPLLCCCHGWYVTLISFAMLLSWLICYTDFHCYAVVMVDMLHWFPLICCCHGWYITLVSFAMMLSWLICYTSFLWQVLLAMLLLWLICYTGFLCYAIVMADIYYTNFLWQVLLAMLLSWLICYILTVTGVLTDNKEGWGYGARTDTKPGVIANADWFRFPYPGL